jgi:hypothetical protein
MKSISQNSATDKFALDELYESAFGRTIAFRRVFVTITGSVTAALMLSQLWYWKDKGRNLDGWIYKTQKEWLEEIGLTRSEQETARRILREKGFIEEKKMGVPCKLHYRVNLSAVFDAVATASNEETKTTREAANDNEEEQPVCGIPTNLNAENLQTDMQKSRKLDCGNLTNKSEGKPQSITEITTKITSKTTQRLTSGSASRAAINRSASKTRKSPLSEVPKPIIDALAEISCTDTNIVSNKRLDELGQAGAALKSWYDARDYTEDSLGYLELADEIRRFRPWWDIQDWRGEKGQTPTPNEVRDIWGKYQEDCRKCPERVWESGQSLFPGMFDFDS